MTKKAAAVRRVVRWVEGFKGGSQPIFWNQMKTGKKGDREIVEPSDRRIDFAYPKEGKTDGKRKHSDAVQKRLQKAADDVIKVIQKIADGDVSSFFFSPESGNVRYIQEIDFDGRKIQENRATDDETVLEAAQDFADLVADETASTGKPLEVADLAVAGKDEEDE